MTGVLEYTEVEYDRTEHMYNMGKITLGEWMDYNALFMLQLEHMENKIRSHLAEDLTP